MEKLLKLGQEMEKNIHLQHIWLQIVHVDVQKGKNQLYKKGELIKNSKKIWFCVGTYTNKQDCKNSIVTTKEDPNLTYLGAKRYYLCDICNNKNKKREVEVLSNLLNDINKIRKGN